MISATSTLPEFAEVLTRYIELSGKTSDEVLRQKTKQLLLGVGKDTAHQKGLFDRLADTAPKRGSVFADRKADDFRLGNSRSTSLLWAREKANAMLGAARLGIFRIVSGNSGGVDYPAQVAVGQVRQKGKRAGELAFSRGNKMLKTGRRATLGAGGIVDESLREQAKKLGASVLNFPALVAALAIGRREKSRLATAAQFLPGRYRRVLDERGTRAKAVVQNKKGTTMGAIEIEPGGTFSDASIRITGLRGLHTPAQKQAIGEALAVVVSDMAVYFERKLAEARAKAGLA